MKILPWMFIGLLAASGPAVADETCVEVEIGGQRSPNFDCLNQQLQSRVEAVHPIENSPPLAADSSAVSLGSVNQTALRQQYGPNFGKSAVPYRPTTTYSSALH